MLGVEIRVKGKVQGVGFRPFVWQIAHQLSVNGEVLNDGQGVLIRLEDNQKLSKFLQLLTNTLPPLAQIESQQTSDYIWNKRPTNFSIVQSESTSIDTQIVPDAATCPECLAELYQVNNSRYLYPFINCTHCGPRFTIIEQLPYDRPKTVMKVFPLCKQCNSEYQDPSDRRYHAQPVACSSCGPKVWIYSHNTTIYEGEWLTHVVEALNEGNIIAIKSVGGFHLICDATNRSAVQKLRNRKKRQFKPFAVMVKDIKTASSIAYCSVAEKNILKSRIAPITLLKKRKNILLAENIAPELAEIGVILPSNPVQHLISDGFSKPVIMTSGNGSGLPPALSNQQAIDDLKDIADIFVLHNRDILHRCDDSLLRVNELGQKETLRRSRGLVPDAINLPKGFPSADGYLAYGGDLKAAFAIGKGNQVIVSQYLGDLANIESQQQYQDVLAHYQSVYQLAFKYHVADKHPGYFSHRLAKKNSDETIEVQHHHAHVASCLVENGWPLNDKRVLALALDGLGLGDNNEFWGGELFLVNYKEYKVIGGIPAIKLIGGDETARQPWRSLYCHLTSFAPELKASTLEALFNNKPFKLLDKALNRNINTFSTRSTGRLFDAVAASLNISENNIEYEGQAACQLEAIASNYTGSKNSPIEIECKDLTLDLTSFWPQWLSLKAENREKAFWFHQSLAIALAKIVKKAQLKYAVDHLILTGGVFHNKLLSHLLKKELGESITTLQHHDFSCGDGGIALGQLAIALCKNKQTK